MKNSDMKVIAIILSIALFFTIVTSNVVSIASVVYLAKGGKTVESADGGATNNDANVSTNNGTSTTPDATQPSGGTSTTPDATQPSGGTSTTPDATQPSGGSSTTPDATQPSGGDSGANSGATNSPVDKDALALYQNAAKEIATKGNASYNKKVWQAIKTFNMGSMPGFIQDAVMGAIQDAMKTEDEAEEKLYEKGDASKGHMPMSNCTENTVSSASKEASGDKTIVTIVMKDQVNPTREDTDGVHVMATGDFLYVSDVYSTLEGNAALKALITLEKGEITYKAFTIKAVITKDGKFESIDMHGLGDIVADIKVGGTINATGQMDFNIKYWNFQY